MQRELPPQGNTPAQRIRWARLKLDLTIVETAKLTGLTPEAISHIENHGTGNITTFKILAAVLHQPIWFLGCFESLPENTLGQCIQKARLYHGLNKREFAKCVGVNEKTVRLWEINTCQPSAESMETLKLYLQII